VIAAQIEQADVLALNEPETLRLMNGKLPIYIRFGQVKPAPITQPFLATWQPHLKKLKVLKTLPIVCKKICKP
jgi:23S rRNA (guanine2445-N2)-methyltransferase / 23S rRNA (guanine2069-N7)-methyltransferase